MATNKSDLLICGGGYVGLGVAVAVKASAPDLDVTVIDAAPKDVWKRDPRAAAVAAAAQRMLSTLGVWEDIAPDAQPINEMIVTDSRTSDPIRPVFLTFDGEVMPGEPFAHMVPNVTMIKSLRKKAAKLGVKIHQSAAATGLDVSSDKATVTSVDGRIWEARLVIAADGGRSSLRDLAGIRTSQWDYGQSGIVTTVAHERPHNGRAVEHFLPAGPFAILPLKGNRSSLVWSERTADADALITGDDMIFEMELERRFGHHLGELRLDGPRRAFPLGLTLARDFVKPRLALAGDAAHGIHPIAGQGLNLGFKDVAALAETIVEAARIGLDIGALPVLERYQLWRRYDTFQMGVTTDVLTRLFSNDITPVRIARNFGLSIVDRLPTVKNFFIKQAAGFVGKDAPKLLRGEAI